jgi:hypothetical protein
VVVDSLKRVTASHQENGFFFKCMMHVKASERHVLSFTSVCSSKSKDGEKDLLQHWMWRILNDIYLHCAWLWSVIVLDYYPSCWAFLVSLTMRSRG